MQLVFDVTKHKLSITIEFIFCSAIVSLLTLFSGCSLGLQLANCKRDLMIMDLLESGQSAREIEASTGICRKITARILSRVTFEHTVNSCHEESEGGQFGHTVQTAHPESESVFTHMTAVTPIENPWHDNDKSEVVIAYLSLIKL